MGSRCVAQIVEGSRNSEMHRLAWILSRCYAFPKKHFAVWMYEENERRCTPPLPHAEMAGIVHRIVREAVNRQKAKAA